MLNVSSIMIAVVVIVRRGNWWDWTHRSYITNPCYSASVQHL